MPEVTYKFICLNSEDDADAEWAVIRQQIVGLDEVELVTDPDGTFTIHPKTATTDDDDDDDDDDEAVVAPVKYTTTPENGMLRIKAARDIPAGNISKGAFGGLIEHERNLSQQGDCWVNFTSSVFGQAKVSHNAVVTNSRISGAALVTGNAKVHSSTVTGDVCVTESAHVASCALSGYGTIAGKAHLYDSKLEMRDDHINGTAWARELSLEPDRAERVMLSYGKLHEAVLASQWQVLSVGCKWGTLDFYPIRRGGGKSLHASVGCQNAGSLRDLLHIAEDEGLDDRLVVRLRLLVAAAVELGRDVGVDNLDAWTE